MSAGGTIGFVVACALAAPSAAAAQEPVRVDPDSPAGVEYQLPLEQARRDTAPDGRGEEVGGGPRGGAGPGSPAPLFGAGISRGGSQSGAGDAEQQGDRGHREATGAGGRGAAGSGPSASAGGATDAEDRGGSTGLILGGIGLAVVAVGGALGLALRRGLRPTPVS